MTLLLVAGCGGSDETFVTTTSNTIPTQGNSFAGQNYLGSVRLPDGAAVEIDLDFEASGRGTALIRSVPPVFAQGDENAMTLELSGLTQQSTGLFVFTNRGSSVEETRAVGGRLPLLGTNETFYIQVEDGTFKGQLARAEDGRPALPTEATASVGEFRFINPEASTLSNYQFSANADYNAGDPLGENPDQIELGGFVGYDPWEFIVTLEQDSDNFINLAVIPLRDNSIVPGFYSGGTPTQAFVNSTSQSLVWTNVQNIRRGSGGGITVSQIDSQTLNLTFDFPNLPGFTGAGQCSISGALNCKLELTSQ